MKRILNEKTLTVHGNIEQRKQLLQILEVALNSADPFYNTKNLLKRKGDLLYIGAKKFEPYNDPDSGVEVIDLSKIKNIYVIGAGKGSQRVAKAIEDIIGDKICAGHIIDKKGTDKILNKIGVTFGGHPVPDEDSVSGSLKIVDILKKIRKEDLVFTIASNGISSLLTLPVPGVTLEDVIEVTRVMQVVKGVPTQELNAIRNHIDVLKGGKISSYLSGVLSFHILALEPREYHWFMWENMWLHTLPDATTYEDAFRIIEKWDVRDLLPKSVISFLLDKNYKFESINGKTFQNMKFRIFCIMPDQNGFLDCAMNEAKKLGYDPVILAENLQAEAKDAGIVIAAIAKTIGDGKCVIKPPCALFTRGELLVTVGQGRGIGGRNQEFVLSASLKIKGNKKIVIGAVDTDGTDGPGSQIRNKKAIHEKEIEKLPILAGGLVDGYTCDLAKEKNIDIEKELRNHNSTFALWNLASGIVASHNISLQDLGIVLIAR